MYEKYKNSYKVTEKELVSLSVYNVGFQRCDSLYQWGPGIRDHYLIHYIISGKGFYKIGKRTYELQAGDSFLAVAIPPCEMMLLIIVPVELENLNANWLSMPDL